MGDVKFIVVCTFGAGSSLMLRLNVEAALREMGVERFTVEVSDMGSSKDRRPTAYLCSVVLQKALEEQSPGAPVVGIKNFYSKDELKAALSPFIAE